MEKMRHEKINQSPDSQEKLEFLFSDHQFAAEERWKFAEHTWEVFKYYITLLTGAGGFILALITLSIDWRTLIWSISISATIIFVIGLTVFMQLIRLDIQLKSVERRLHIARQEIAKITALEYYIDELVEAKSDMGISYTELGYSLRHQIRRAIIGMGLKTQLILINSAIGTLAITLTICSLYRWTDNVLLVVFISYLSIVFFHVIIARIRAKVGVN